MGRLAGKVAIVTGAASGIGRAAAILFASEGAQLVLADRDEAVMATHARVRDHNVKAEALRLDTGDEASVQKLVETAIATFGGLDVTFANAGILGGIGGLFEQTAADWGEVLRVNLIGPFLAIKYAAPEIAKRGGGSIVCTASIAGMRSGAGNAAYSASKAGVINLVQTAAQQLSGTHVRVNAVCPGLIETSMTQTLYDRAREGGTADAIGHLNPLHRGGEPDEIARVALFLASDEASYVNGQALAVDGGLSSSHPFSRQDYGKTAI